jgi:predicted glycosyltransferase
MGHLFRSLELARAFEPHAVKILAGGQPVDVELPPHIEMVRLPTLYMDENFTHLISGEPDRDVESVKAERLDMMEKLFATWRPDVFIVELFPFGRTAFQFELVPLLTKIRQAAGGPVKTVCSLRDILVEKKDPGAYEERVLGLLRRHFDLLMIHSDERLLPLDKTFRREGDIDIPVVYTGFITRKPDPRRIKAVKRQLKLPDNANLIVASAGGGRSGYPLLRPVIEACRRLGRSMNFQLEVFAGPFMDEEAYSELEAMADSRIHVRRFSDVFLEYLALADLSISLAGYNTCMNLLVTGVPSLVLPYTRQQEQPLRVDALRDYLPLRAMVQSDLDSERLMALICTMLEKSRLLSQVPLNLDGADTAAEYVVQWASG